MTGLIGLFFYYGEPGAMYIACHLYWLLLIVKYIHNFPYVSYKVTHIYCFLLISLEVSNIMFTVWEYSDLLNEDSFPITFFVVNALV